jgi:NitT/TauT family transport system ATP-binding protein
MTKNKEEEFIRLENVTKYYLDKKGQKTDVLTGFNFSVQRGEFITFFGPNACGKSTLLGIIGGLISPNSGIIRINEKSPGQAKIGFIFQNYHKSLLPWRTNLANIAFPLELNGTAKHQRKILAKELASKLGFNLPEEGYPYQLSGGQQQLLCIGRALISSPDVLLMDEPFNQLDYQTRIEMNEKVQDIWLKTGRTILFVSHDLEEAVALADRIVILSKRPAKIAEIISNPLPRPRNTKILQSEAFFQLKSKALAAFEKVIKI